jgi:two-component system response regulator MprA
VECATIKHAGATLTGVKGTILLVEDDVGVRESLELGLSLEGYRVLAAATGNEAIRGLASSPDLIVLDVLLPGADGFNLLREIRTRSATPVIMLTALQEVEWRVKGLREGADDYLVKPYALAELAARIEALLRRTRRDEAVLRYANLELYVGRMQAHRAGRDLELTPKAFLLLKAFLENPERVLSRDVLMQAGWGGEVEPNTLEVHLSALRRALGEPALIRTIRGYGYALRQP